MSAEKTNKILVIVESPAKARTLSKFLPRHFEVTASMGHVRDLPQSATEIPARLKGEGWAKLGVNVENNFEPLYVTSKGKGKIINEIKGKLKKADQLYLATDEDREGESISWHLLELLKPKIPVKRMVFHEITQEAILEALEHCRDIDPALVEAQETRRILDRLVGYTLSPLIWKKIAYGLSAGRVQSAGLRMIVERERERIRFKSGTYWDLAAELAKGGKVFEAKLFSIDGNRIATGKDFDESTGKLKADKNVRLIGETEAKKLEAELKKETWKVSAIEKRDFNSSPAAPFITSTLQMEANRKLGFAANRTMRTAQRLYEAGHISYMRTDSPALSTQAITAARECVEARYGKEYLFETVRQYKSKSKGAQEAHEAIRPAGAHFQTADESGLEGDDYKLYDLIWKRTVATQMSEAQKQSQTVRIAAGSSEFTASGTRILFPGFIRAYVEGDDDPEAALEDKEVVLPELQEGENLNLKKLEALSHETKPPARYTEASLVRRLEQEGIGRPSTYASILSTIIDRDYARKQGNALCPTFTGFAVVQLLERHFNEWVDYGFTARMEQTLDEIAEGEKKGVPYLREFYLDKTHGLKTHVDEKESLIDPEESRVIHLEQIAGADVRVGRYGAYFEKGETKASIPIDLAPADLTEEVIQELVEVSEKGGESIGRHPESGEPIFCLVGRYGPYVQLGEATEETPKPRRASVPKSIPYREITVEQAAKLLSLPRELGPHPDSGKPVTANNGRFGPYVVHAGEFRSIKKDFADVYTITLEEGLRLLAEPKRGRGGNKVLKELGNHPSDNKPVKVYEGRFGPYIKYKSSNVSVPKDQDIEKLTLEAAIELIKAKKGKK